MTVEPTVSVRVDPHLSTTTLTTDLDTQNSYEQDLKSNAQFAFQMSMCSSSAFTPKNHHWIVV